MRAIRVERHGGPEVMETVDIDPPRPRAGQVVVTVRAADVLGLDLAIRRGGHVAEYFGVSPPYVPGDGVAGIVSAVGADVDDGLVGRSVTATTGGRGGYAEQVAVDAADLVEVPDGLAPADAVAVLHDGRTAYALMRAVGIEPGDRVLVTPAASGLGLLLVQLARAAGAQVIAAAGGGGKLAAASAAGADRTVDHRQPGWSSGVEADVVLDGVGGDVGRAAFAAVAPGGRYLAFGDSGGTAAVPDPRDVDERRITVIGPEVVHLGSSGHARDLTDRAMADVAAGTIRPVLTRYALRDAARAHRDLESRRTIGRPVLHP